MTYKSLLLHVDPTEAGRARLRLGVHLAKRFGAHIVGIGARAFDAMPDPIGLSITKLQEAVDAELALAKQIFDEEIAGAGVPGEWRAEIDYPTQAMLRHAASADLIITERNIDAMPQEKQAAAADLILAGGAPVLIAPRSAPLSFDEVCIAWKNTPEARRAVWDSLPFLTQAKRVRILRFGRAKDSSAGAMNDVLKRLRLHGVRAESEQRERKGATVAEDLMLAAEGALIVAGGYGHSRLREWALGGVTHDLLQACESCVLFSH